MGAKGAFILGQVNARQLSSRASTVDAASIVGINNWDFGVSGTYGWFIAGSPVSTIDRIDFANDFNTAIFRAGMLGGTSAHAVVGNQNYAWSSWNTTIERLDFSNDSGLPALRGSMQETALNRNVGLSNNNFGWYAGHLAPAIVSNSSVYRIDFANDNTQVSRRGNLSTVRAVSSAGVSNAFYGWIAGGNTPPTAGGPYSSIERIDFSNDTPTAVNRSNLTAANTDLAGDGNINFGWFAGGNSPAPAIISTIQRIEYANDTVAATVRGPLPAVTRTFSGAGNNNFGWFGGGGNAVPAVVSIVNRIDFSNDSPTSATTRGPLSVARSGVKAVSNIVSTVPSTQYPTQGLGTNEALSGYVWSVGGGNPGYVSRIERIDLSSDSPTSASTRGSLLSARSSSGASNASYGWFGLGNGTLGNNQTTVERLDFANDSPSSTSARGLFTVGRFEAAAVGNANYGWFGGGYRAGGFGVQTLVDRIDFANDSPTAPSLRGPLSSGRRYLAAVNNSNFGWFAGGVDTVGNVYVTIERMDFANDSPTTASPRGPLTTGRGHLAAAGNANYGWFGGGFFPGPFAFYSVVNRVDYSNDSPTTSSIRASLNTSRAVYGAAGNANYGWWIGGSLSGITLVERMEYSNDLVTPSLRGNVAAVTANAAVSNYVKPNLNQQHIQQPFTGGRTDGTYGWFTGGTATINPPDWSTVDRIDFSNDSPTSASVRGPLTSTRDSHDTLSNSNYGWIAGGLNPALTNVDRIDFANDLVAASPRSTITNAARHSQTFSTDRYGYRAGSTLGTATSIFRTDFSNDLSGQSLNYFMVASNRNSGGGAANNFYGWLIAGYNSQFIPSSTLSSVERIDFSNSLVTASPRGNIATAIGQHYQSVGNTNYSWTLGGRTVGGPGTSQVQRIDYANDLAVALVRGSLIGTRYNGGSTGSSNSGYTSGGSGFSSGSSVDRINFSNDTATSTFRGPLSRTAWFHRALSNYVNIIPIFNVTQYAKGSNTVGTGAGTFGWWAGGYTPGTTFSIVDRLDFANDTVTATARGNLSVARWQPRSIGNNNFGWTGGGSTPAPTVFSTIDRVDFSNDSPTSAQTRGPLSIARYGTGVAGNSNYGWWAGGFGTSLNRSTVDRLDFANDALATSVRGDLFGARQNLAAAGNENYGWYAGGSIAGPTYRSDVARIDFANDSPTVASARGFLAVAKNSMAAASNTFYAWFAGGFGAPSTVSTVERIDFANDSPTTAIARGPLTSIKNTQGGAGNSNYGYFGGGAPVNSQVERIDYSNDLVAAVLRSSLTASRSDTTAMSNYTK